MRSEGLQCLVCHSVRPSVRPRVCLLPRFLPPRATRQQNSGTNRFTLEIAICVIETAKIQSALAIEILRYGMKTKSTWKCTLLWSFNSRLRACTFSSQYLKCVDLTYVSVTLDVWGELASHKRSLTHRPQFSRLGIHVLLLCLYSHVEHTHTYYSALHIPYYFHNLGVPLLTQKP